MTRSAYLQALLDAAVAGHYVDAVLPVYFREDGFKRPRAFAFDFGY